MPQASKPAARTRPARKATISGLAKCPSGVRGLDQIMGGGLPQGRTTLVCGSAGCGKTLLAMEFLTRGATEYGENGVCLTFEESIEDLARNVASLGFNLRSLVDEKKLAADHVRIDRCATAESGSFTLDGIFARLGHAIDQVKAKRVVLDTLEHLFASFIDKATVRSELNRLFTWLKDRGVTAIVTAERGEAALTRDGLEEYVSDCVILLDHRMNEQLATRRLRVVKYRGSTHGTNEYPFLIDDKGIVVVPVTSSLLEQAAPTSYVSSGIPQLDQMLGGKGYYAGSTVLVSGGAGTGKTSMAAFFVDRACQQGARALYFAFEESARQIMRSMNSIGLDLKRWVDKGLLKFDCVRPTQYGLEMHLASMHAALEDFGPKVVVVDPITDLSAIGTTIEVRAMLTRLVDHLKCRSLTVLLTGLIHDEGQGRSSAIGISSLIDTWLQLEEVEVGCERNRTVTIRKSRGMAHSNQVREFLMSSKGISLVDVCLGPHGVLTGSSRIAHEMGIKREALMVKRRREMLEKKMQSRRKAVEARIIAQMAELDAEQYLVESDFDSNLQQERQDQDERVAIAEMRSRSDGRSKHR